MGFKIFNEHTVQEECREMFIALRNADYAISTLEKEQIERYANHYNVSVKLRKLKYEGVKVSILREETK